MRTRSLIEIPNHPLFPTVTRKAQVRSSNNCYSTESVTMVLNIFCFIDGEEVKDMYREIPMICDNSMINPQTFAYVEADEDGVYPAGSIGEYDFLFDLVSSKIKTQFELEEMFINLRISSINKKLYNI